MLQTMEIKTDGVTISLKPANKKQFTINELQDAVHGMVKMYYLERHKAYLVINEEGKMLSLPFNSMATDIYRDSFKDSPDVIVGNALIAQKTEIS